VWHILPTSAKTQSDGCNCGVYTSLSWSMFVAVERTNPGLWKKIESLVDLDKEIVKPFWDLHENKEDRMINFRYKLCRLMEFFLDKHIVKRQCSMIAVGGHPLPDNWVYPKKARTCRLTVATMCRRSYSSRECLREGPFCRGCQNGG
jgi:hypothetical protein